MACHPAKVLGHPTSGHVTLKLSWSQLGRPVLEASKEPVIAKITDQSFEGPAAESMKRCLLALRWNFLLYEPGVVVGIRVDYSRALETALAPRTVARDAADLDLDGYSPVRYTKVGS
jgi:hypothetical protein